MTDDGLPAPQSATNSFWVTVYECVEASLGRTIVYAGESNSVPIYLLSTVELTNLYFHVLYPPERLTNFSVQADAHPAMAPLASNVACGQCYIGFTWTTNEVLHGPTNVGTLCFQTDAGTNLGLRHVAGHRCRWV